jgi:hypothetical protein
MPAPQPGTCSAVVVTDTVVRLGIEGTVLGGPRRVVKFGCGERPRRAPCHRPPKRLLCFALMANATGNVNPFSKAILSFAIVELRTRS